MDCLWTLTAADKSGRLFMAPVVTAAVAMGGGPMAPP